MPSSFCPNCQKVKLIKCKILRSNHPDRGREYLVCSGCSSQWFLDDPDLPMALSASQSDHKSKKSFWEKLGSWGAPNNVPDHLGQLHPATYVLPPLHDYPPVLLPISGPARRSFSSFPKSADSSHPSLLHSPSSIPPHSPSHSTNLPKSPSGTSIHTHQPSITPSVLPSKINSSSSSQAAFQLESSSDHSHQDLVNSPLTPTELEPTHQIPQFDQKSQPKSPSLAVDQEERSRFDLLTKIATSPPPPLSSLLDQIDNNNLDQISDRSSLHHPQTVSENHPTESLSSQEEQYRQTLMKVAMTPLPISPISHLSYLVPTGTLSPHQNPLPDLQLDISAYTKHISHRLDQAILNSPFIHYNHLSTPHSEFMPNPPTFASQSSPPQHSNHPTPNHSPTLSARLAPRSYNQTDYRKSSSNLSHPQSPNYNNSINQNLSPRLGSLTADAVRRLESLTPHYDKSLKSASRAASLPAPPSHFGSVIGSLNNNKRSMSGRLSPASAGTQSPLFR
ncbi:hypothetical protein O181_059734 [Austropuccinia psidii MF-1]|uniref:Uncharacterized protein n=1 Tax=Austropuccinia psidii MF-1 TaxID=1389203 RepID=A0A9Q3EEU8_9BASI|nr:hypothetical protein [Austropuccinia psidii MF-1]